VHYARRGMSLEEETRESRSHEMPCPVPQFLTPNVQAMEHAPGCKALACAGLPAGALNATGADWLQSQAALPSKGSKTHCTFGSRGLIW